MENPKMVENGSENSSKDEAESALQSVHTEERNKHPFSLLRRQLSIYSLTLDEFEHTLSDGSKNFGSMNMDEFLNNIWTAEENQAQTQAAAATTTIAAGATVTAPNAQFSTDNSNIVKQLSLSRQGTLTLPAAFFQKTVDEVWSEMEQEQQNNSTNNDQNLGSTHRQPTFGEMTLEDFLVKAGVELVEEQVHQTLPPQLQLQPQPPFGMYQNSNNALATVGASYKNRPVIGPIGGDKDATLPQSGVVESSSFLESGKMSAEYQTPTICSGGHGGHGPCQLRPVSPVSPDRMCARHALEMSGCRGARNRIIDGRVERVVEKRQKRMIKNRESAARSRARKQAYTTELEAELDFLKEENKRLKRALYFERLAMKVQTNTKETKTRKAKEKWKMMRRNMSCSF